jgi:hypothetical protein
MKSEAMRKGPGKWVIVAGAWSPDQFKEKRAPTVPRPARHDDQAAGSARAVLAHYFNVDAIDAAAGRVQAGGGQILSGSMEVPGGLWIVQCRDPQGAVFCLVAPRR